VISQSFGSPLALPRWNAATRCADVPWVKLSGSIEPDARFCRRSSPTLEAASSASAMSPDSRSPAPSTWLAQTPA
jgi:hypothetical protein